MSDKKEKQSTDFESGEGVIDERNPLHIGRDIDSIRSKRERKARKKGDPTPAKPITISPDDAGEPKALPENNASILAKYRKRIGSVISSLVG